MSLNGRDNCGLNIKCFLIDVAFGVVGVVAAAASTAFCYLGGDRLHALTFRPSVCSVAAYLVFGRSFALLSFLLIFPVCAGHIRLLFKLFLKFRNALKHAESGSSLACNENIKEYIPTALNDINRYPQENIHVTRE